jgi:hypothetical protein
MAHIIKEEKKYFNFLYVWNHQKVSPAVQKALDIITEKVYEELTNPPAGITNVGQWAKKEGCWLAVQKLQIDLPQEFFDELLEKGDMDTEKKQAKKIQRIDNGIEAQKLVFDLAEKKKWCEIKQFGIENDMFSPLEMDLMDLACEIPNKIPSEKQALTIVNALHNLEEIGYSVGF